MSQVSLTPIPVDGGSIVDLSTAGYCQMGNGQYFVVYAQTNPNHVFGCLYTVTGEGTSSPSITIQKTQSIAGIAPSTANSTHYGLRVAKLNDNTVAILVQSNTSANVYPIRIDADDDNNMYQVDDEYTMPSITAPQYMSVMFEQVAENQVAFGWSEYRSTTGYMYCHLDKISFSTTSDNMSVTAMSVPTSGQFMENGNRNYGWVSMKEVKSTPGEFFITYYLNSSATISQSNGYMIFRSNFSGSQVYDVMARSGASPQDQDLGDLQNSLPIAYSTSDWYMVGEGVGYVRGYGTNNNNVTSELSFANDIGRDYRIDSSYLEWHQLGNDDEKTMVYIHSNHGTNNNTDQWTDDQFRNPYNYRIRVLKPGSGNTLICSPATSGTITFSTPSVTPMTTQPESFYKVSESVIGMVGVKNRTSNASHEIVMCYLKF